MTRQNDWRTGDRRPDANPAGLCLLVAHSRNTTSRAEERIVDALLGRFHRRVVELSEEYHDFLTFGAPGILRILQPHRATPEARRITDLERLSRSECRARVRNQSPHHGGPLADAFCFLGFRRWMQLRRPIQLVPRKKRRARTATM